MARPFPARLFAFAFLGWAFDFYDLVLLGFLKGPVGDTFHLSEASEAWMLGVALGASGVGGIVAGALADRLGKRDVLAATVLLYSLGSLVAGAAPTFPLFLAGRALVGFGVGGEWAIGHGMLAEAVEPSFRGRASALLQAGEPAGVALAAVAGYLLVPLVGWRWVMVGSSATALLAFAMRSSLQTCPTRGTRSRRRWPASSRRASAGACCSRGSSVCSSSAPTGPATRGCRASSSTRCTRASASR